jgi:hypothetical protein
MFKQIKPKDLEYHETYSFEHGFKNYYDEQIKGYFEAAEKTRVRQLNTFYHLLKRNLVIISLLLFISILMIAGPLAGFYHKLKLFYNNFRLNYHEWWSHLSSIPKFLFPSKIFPFDFPNPISFTLLVTAVLFLFQLLLLFQARISIKQWVFLPIIRFINDVNYKSVSNIRNSEFFKVLILPYYNEIINENGSMLSNYKNSTVEISETQLLSYRLNTRNHEAKPNTTITLNGLVTAVNLPYDTQQKIYLFSDPDDKIKQQLLRQLSTKLNFIAHKDVKIYSSDPNITSELGDFIEHFAQTAQIINDCNNTVLDNYPDYKLSHWFKMKWYKLTEGEQRNVVQCVIHNTQMFIMVPFHRELFRVGSLFQPTNLTDVRLLLAAIHMAFQAIDDTLSLQHLASLQESQREDH